MDNLVSILVTGAGAPGGPGIIKALKQDKSFKVYAGDVNQFAAGAFLVDKFNVLPKADDACFVDKMISLCCENNIHVILPLVTQELFVYSREKETFLRNGIKPIVSDYDALQIANDKGRLYEHLALSGIEVPMYKVIDDADKFLETVGNVGYPDVPVVMKPCVGNGSRGIRIFDNTRDKLKLLFDEKPTNLYATVEDIYHTIKNNTIPRLLISEYLPGEELTIDCIVSNNLIKELVIRTRDTIRSGISTSGRFIHNEYVANYIANIVRVLPGLDGPIGFQVKKSSDGIYKLLECNPRLQGTSVSALGMGINLPQLSIYNCIGKNWYSVRREYNVGFVRYYEEVFYKY